MRGPWANFVAMLEEGAQPEGTLDELIRRYCYPEWQELLRERNKRLSFEKGQPIFSPGQKAERMYMVHRGRVKVIADLGRVKERVTRLAGDGEVLGYRGIGQEPIYTAGAVALSPTVLNVIPMQLFLSTLKANSLFCYHFLLYITEEMRRMDQHLRDLVNLEVPDRVAKVLLQCRRTFGMDAEDPKKLAFTLTRKDMASMADTSYESVVRALAYFEERGLIERVGKEVRLRKVKALEKLVARG